MRVAAVLLALAVAAAPAFPAERPLAGDPRVQQALALLDAWLGAEQAYERLPGVSMAVVHDQEALWSRGYGYAHLESREPATPATMYSICSISKLFTSVSVMQQRDAGALRLDDPVTAHLPWVTLEQVYPGSPPITVRGLLTHSSGLPREVDVPYWTGPDYPFPPRERVLERVPQQQTLYPAERNFQYSNLGLTLAGEIVAATSGRPYAEYVEERVLAPLGLEDTETEHRDEYRGGRLATGYSAPRRDGSREPVPPYQVRGIAPAAGFTSTVEDLGRFASWQFRLLAGEGGDDVLAANTLREMQRVQWMDPDWKTSWGLGFAVWRSDEKTFVGHGGYCPGYQSQLLLDVPGELATVFMTNTNGVNSRRYAQRAWKIVAPAVKQALDDPDGGKPPDPSLARYLGRYDDWLAGEEHVILWKDALALVSLPADDPLEALIELRPAGEHRFRRVRDDGSLGEELRFEMGPDGTAARLWRHSNYSTRVP